MGENLFKNIRQALFRRTVDFACVCDRGLVRSDNQDSCVDVDKAVFCVADGMGGGAEGATASAMLCRAVEVAAHGCSDFMTRIESVDYAVLRANDNILAYAVEHGLATMGTTFAALVLDDDARGDRVALGHLGDSRVYRRRDVHFERMTEDHRKSEYSHILTRAVGVRKDITVDWSWAGVARGDIWLVCTDGVHDMLPDSTLNALLARGGTAADMAQRIADAVRRAGARDNFSLYVVIT